MWWNRKQTRAGAADRPGTFEERYAIVRKFGRGGLSFLALYEGWEYFHPPANPGFVAFERHNGTAVVCGDPVSAPDHEAATLAAFVEFCRRERLTPVFANASEWFAERAEAAGLSRVKIGEEPLFDLESWGPRGDRAKKVRSASNQAHKNGVTVEVLDPRETPSSIVEHAVAEVIAEWRTSRRVKALGFTLRLSPLAHSNDKVTLLAWREGVVEAFLTCVPYNAGAAYYFEDLIRRPGASHGASELLVLEAVAECRRRGATLANFGLAPLRACKQQPGNRRAIGWMLDLTFRRLNFFYRFRPLDHYKSKFAPSRYEPAYLVYPPGKLATASVGLLTAFTPGPAGPISTAVSRLQRKSPSGGSVLDLPIAAMSAALSVALLGMLWWDPDLPVHAVLTAARPMLAAEGVARAHLVVDTAIVAAGGGWLARGRR